MIDDDLSLPQPPATEPHTQLTLPPWLHMPVEGELTLGWRALTVLMWIGVVLSFAAVWNSSWKIGLSTWWLGPEASPRFPVIMIVPFIAPVAMVALAFRHMRWIPYFGIAASVITALIAWGDVGRVNGFAAIEFALAAGALLVSVASCTGLLKHRGRSVPSH